MLNESNLSSLGWSSMTMVHMARPMIMCNKDVWWKRTVSWLFYIYHLKNMNMDMDDDGRASWTPMGKLQKKYTAPGPPAGPLR